MNPIEPATAGTEADTLTDMKGQELIFSFNPEEVLAAGGEMQLAKSDWVLVLIRDLEVTHARLSHNRDLFTDLYRAFDGNKAHYVNSKTAREVLGHTGSAIGKILQELNSNLATLDAQICFLRGIMTKPSSTSEEATNEPTDESKDSV